MEKFNGKLLAIKALRDATMTGRVVPIENPFNGRPSFMIDPTLGLKEAKDLVEAIMRLGVREFLKDNVSFRCLHGDENT